MNSLMELEQKLESQVNKRLQEVEMLKKSNSNLVEDIKSINKSINDKKVEIDSAQQEIKKLHLELIKCESEHGDSNKTVKDYELDLNTLSTKYEKEMDMVNEYVAMQAKYSYQDIKVCIAAEEKRKAEMEVEVKRKLETIRELSIENKLLKDNLLELNLTNMELEHDLNSPEPSLTLNQNLQDFEDD
jgi:chromosome segregation ATPase